MPLEQNLILAQYFHSLFGHANFEGMKTVLRSCSEERGEDGDLESIPFAGDRDWDAITRDFAILRPSNDYVQTILRLNA